MGDVPEILLIDDSVADRELVEEAFRQYEVEARFSMANSGVVALARLRDAADRGDPLPDLVLLDLRLPGMDGHQVLHAIREDPRLNGLQVVMVSGSEHAGDIDRSEALHTSYIIKPTNWDEYVVLVRAFQQRLKRKEEHQPAESTTTSETSPPSGAGDPLVTP